MMNKAFFRKVMLIILTVLLAGTLSACTPKQQQASPTPTKPNKSTQNVTQPVKENIAAYYPLKVGNRWEYKGTGNEYAAYKEEVTFAAGQKYQVMVDNGGTRMANRYEVKADRIVITYREGEVYSNKNILSEAANENVMLIKTPVKVGTSWTNGKDKYEITKTDVTVTVPAGTFNNCIEVRVNHPEDNTYTLNDYKKGIGLVKSAFFANGGEQITSELAKYQLK